jgi:hypothetical protein
MPPLRQYWLIRFAISISFSFSLIRCRPEFRLFCAVFFQLHFRWLRFFSFFRAFQ